MAIPQNSNVMESTCNISHRPVNGNAATRLSQKGHTLLGITGLILVSLALRPSLVSVSPVLSKITETFRLSHTVASLLTAIPDVLMGLMALPTPWLARKLGRDRLILIAMSALSICTALRAFSPNAFILLITTAGIGMGIAVTGALLSGFVKATYTKNIAVMMGVYTTSLAVGSTIPAFLTAPVAEQTGSWRIAIGIYALVCLIGTLAWYTLTTYQKAEARPAIPASDHVVLPWNNIKAWRIAFFFACNNLLFYALLAWLPSIFRENKVAGASADHILGYFTSALIIGTPLISAFTRSIDRRVWLAGCSLLPLTGLLMLTFLPQFMPVAVVFVISFGLAGTFTLAMTLPLDNTVTPAETNAWTAFTLLVGYLLAASGPLLVGALRDLTGSFSTALHFLIGTAICMLTLAFTLGPPADRSLSKNQSL